LLIDAVIETTPSMIEKRRSSMQESTPPSLSSIPLYLEKSKNIKFIIKNDLNVRKEHVVASLIEILHYKLIEQSIKKRLDSFDRIPTYKIIMIDKTIGIIEYVENSNTLGSLRTKNISILNHVLEHNNMLTVDVIRSRYAKSLAIWSCISYILGFGDRHLDNIMINKDGLIFHIDYGYITDNPMTNIFSAPIIRITFEMIECLGGENSTYYNLFKNYVADVFNLIRLYTNIIINNYYILGYEKIVDWTDFKNKIIDRFMVGMSGKEVIISLDNEIKNSYNSFSSFSVDLFHSIGSLKTYLTFGLSP
jgi:phosphatidylinositol 3-kinase